MLRLKEFTLEDFIRELNKRHLRYLLIGGQAVTLYGSPVVSFDFDFWVDPVIAATKDPMS